MRREPLRQGGVPGGPRDALPPPTDLVPRPRRASRVSERESAPSEGARPAQGGRGAVVFKETRRLPLYPQGCRDLRPSTATPRDEKREKDRRRDPFQPPPPRDPFSTLFCRLTSPLTPYPRRTPGRVGHTGTWGEVGGGSPTTLGIRPTSPLTRFTGSIRSPCRRTRLSTGSPSVPTGDSRRTGREGTGLLGPVSIEDVSSSPCPTPASHTRPPIVTENCRP